MRIVTEPPMTGRRTTMRLLPRLLSGVRLDEVLVLQGTPLIGASLSVGTLTMNSVLAVAAVAAASICLVAHVFVLNDWSGIRGDLKDPNRAARVFVNRGVSRVEMGYLAAGLLGLSLLICWFLGTVPLVLAVAIAGSSVLYSAPLFNVKGRPILNSVLHLVGGVMHFQLGYATFSRIDARGVALGGFFALVFTAGHLMHEARDREGDLLNGIQTNAVAFGKTRSFVAGLALFTSAYALLVALAAAGILPRILVAAGALYPLHLGASLRALRAGLTYESLLRLQKCYRALFAIIGIGMLATSPALPRWLP